MGRFKRCGFAGRHISLEGEGRGRCVRIVPAAGAAVELPVLSGQMQAAEAFLKRIDALEVRKPPT